MGAKLKYIPLRLIEAVDKMDKESLPQRKDICMRQCALIRGKIMQYIEELYDISADDLAMIDEFNAVTMESEN